MLLESFNNTIEPSPCVFINIFDEFERIYDKMMKW